MTDWAGCIEQRNYGIKHVTDARHLNDLLRIIGPLAILVGFLFFFSWVQSQLVSLGYESQRLQTAEETLIREQKSLILEEETLKNPMRIDSIARNDLDMAPLRPNQLIPSGGGSGIPSGLAMAGALISPAAAGGASVTN